MIKVTLRELHQEKNICFVSSIPFKKREKEKKRKTLFLVV